jgi:hypothetical protein
MHQYAVRHLERHPPGTPYPQVCRRAAELFAAPPLSQSLLAVDYTGVGRPILDMLRRTKVKARICPVLVTAGHRSSSDPRGGWSVPRHELAATLQVLLQSRRLRVSPGLPEASTLLRELAAFQVKVKAAADEPDAWREGSQDDLVLAVAVAAWLKERALRRLAVWL